MKETLTIVCFSLCLLSLHTLTKKTSRTRNYICLFLNTNEFWVMSYWNNVIYFIVMHFRNNVNNNINHTIIILFLFHNNFTKGTHNHFNMLKLNLRTQHNTCKVTCSMIWAPSDRSRLKKCLSKTPVNQRKISCFIQHVTHNTWEAWTSQQVC